MMNANVTFLFLSVSFNYRFHLMSYTTVNALVQNTGLTTFSTTMKHTIGSSKIIENGGLITARWCQTRTKKRKTHDDSNKLGFPLALQHQTGCPSTSRVNLCVTEPAQKEAVFTSEGFFLSSIDKRQSENIELRGRKEAATVQHTVQTVHIDPNTEACTHPGADNASMFEVNVLIFLHYFYRSLSILYCPPSVCKITVQSRAVGVQRRPYSQ